MGREVPFKMRPNQTQQCGGKSSERVLSPPSTYRRRRQPFLPPTLLRDLVLSPSPPLPFLALFPPPPDSRLMLLRAHLATAGSRRGERRRRGLEGRWEKNEGERGYGKKAHEIKVGHTNPPFRLLFSCMEGREIQPILP